MTTEHSKEVEEVGRVLESQLAHRLRFETPPNVKLVLCSVSPAADGEVLPSRSIAVTTAYQCYAKGLSKFTDRSGDLRAEAIADSTLDAGHHTTRMHAHYTFLLDGVTRDVTHDVLHNHPFYNSEQQSQRYVEAKDGSYLVPSELTNEQKVLYLEAAGYANNAYFKLEELLLGTCLERVTAMYPKGSDRVPATKERMSAKAKKISQEVARYVLPIGQKTTMEHTLSSLQLIRLFRVSQMPGVTREAQFVVASMVDEVLKIDPTFINELRPPLLMKNQGENLFAPKTGSLSGVFQGRRSVLVNGGTVEESLNGALTTLRLNTGGAYSDSELLEMLFDPSSNPILADVYESGMFDSITQTMRLISPIFATRLSHAADSQRQRHRRTPGVTSILDKSVVMSLDYETPMIIQESPEIKQEYDAIMAETYWKVQRAIDGGVPWEYAKLLLPNAQRLFVVESGDLFDWVHRWKQRLCLLAQEEIYFTSVDQVEQIGKVIPAAQALFRAPCAIRKLAGVSPRCPEGDRWCGQPVFNWESIDSYKKGRKV